VGLTPSPIPQVRLLAIALGHPNGEGGVTYDSAMVRQRRAITSEVLRAISSRHGIRTRFRRTDKSQTRHIRSHHRLVPRVRQNHKQDKKMYGYWALK